MLTVHLLGPPRVSVGGDVAPAPRGRKVWAILAYLVASEGPVERSRLAELLFSEADDPMGALRWSLAELRRLLGPSVRIGGAGVVTVRLPLDVWVDVEVLRRDLGRSRRDPRTRL